MANKNTKTRRLSRGVGSLFGVGFFPFMPGTAAALVTACIAWLVARTVSLSLIWDIEIFLVLLLLGLLSAYDLIRHEGVKDPGWFVMDEAAGMWLALLGLPKDNLPVLAAAFAVFRIFDIAKPWIIKKADRLPGAAAIMLDDLLAAVPAWLTAFGLWKILS